MSDESLPFRLAGSMTAVGDVDEAIQELRAKDKLSRRDAILRGAVSAAPLLGIPAVADAQPTQAPRSARPPRTRDYIIDASAALIWRNGAPQLIRECSVRVRGNDIVEVREGRIGGTAARINATGQLLLPGFISGHTHAASGSPTRGLIEDGRSYQRPIELVEQLPDDLLDDITAYNVAEFCVSVGLAIARAPVVGGSSIEGVAANAASASTIVIDLSRRAWTNRRAAVFDRDRADAR